MVKGAYGPRSLWSREAKVKYQGPKAKVKGGQGGYGQGRLWSKGAKERLRSRGRLWPRTQGYVWTKETKVKGDYGPREVKDQGAKAMVKGDYGQGRLCMDQGAKETKVKGDYGPRGQG